MRLTPTLLGTKPAVGSLSDLTGRRRPFVVVGALLVAGGLSLLAGAEARASVGAALLGLWLLDIGETTRGRAPARASGGGGLTETKASTAPTRRCGCWRPTFAPALSRPWPTRRSRRASVWGRCEQEGPGRVPGKPDTPRPVPQIFGYCLSSVRFAPELHRAKVSDKAFCFALGAAAQVGALAATLALGPRAPPQKAATGKGGGGWRWKGWRAAGGGLLALGRQERWMWQLCFVNGIGWVAWFAFFLFGTHFVAKDVFGGDPEAPEGSAARARCKWIAPSPPLHGPTEPAGGGEEEGEA